MFYESGQFKKAIDEYDKAVQADPEHGSAYASRGAAYEKLAEHERAIEDYDRAIELDPTVASSYENRGAAYHNLSQYQGHRRL